MTVIKHKVLKSALAIILLVQAGLIYAASWI